MRAGGNLTLGGLGESAALDLLRSNNYKILAKNYKTKLGEIDIVAKDKDTICFVEVKTRSQDRFGTPCDAVLESKQRQISKTALMFLKDKGLLDKKARFDVVSVTYSKGYAQLRLIKNAFELDDSFTY